MDIRKIGKLKTYEVGSCDIMIFFLVEQREHIILDTSNIKKSENTFLIQYITKEGREKDRKDHFIKIGINNKNNNLYYA